MNENAAQMKQPGWKLSERVSVELKGGELLVKMAMLKKMEAAYYDALSNY